METSDLGFRMFLCEKLGRTQRELDDCLTPGEYREWAVYFKSKNARRAMAEQAAAQRAKQRR